MLALEFIRSLRLGWSWGWSKFLNHEKKLNRFLSRRKEFRKDETILIHSAEDRCWAEIQTETVEKAIQGSRSCVAGRVLSLRQQMAGQAGPGWPGLGVSLSLCSRI